MLFLTLCQVSLAVLTYVGLLAYTQVFIQSFTNQIWPSAPSFIPNVLFGLVVIPLSCFDLAEQITVQVLMSILRFLSFGILIGVTSTAIFSYKTYSDITYDLPIDGPANNYRVLQGDAGDGYRRLLYGDTEFSDRGVPLCDFSGFGVMFTTAIFR